MSALIRIRRDTTAAWNTAPIPTLADGEWGLDTTLRQVKIGDGVSAWNNLPWLGGSLPYFASPNADIDSASNRVMGLYRFTDVSAITAGVLPAAPIDIKVADGGINMLVLQFGPVVVQNLWTDGDGTQPPKSYSRVYDTAWRAWTAQSLWGVDGTEGVDASVRDITVKRNALVEGDLSVQGNTAIGDSATDVGVFQQGTAAAPSQTFAGDLDTGAYSPAADEWAVATNGTRRIHQNDTTTTVDENLVAAKNLSVSGQLAAALHCGGQVLTNLGTPTTAAGAMRLDDLVVLSRVSMAYRGSDGSVTGSDGSVNWTFAGLGTATATATASAGNWRGLAFGIDSGGNIMSAAILVKTNNTGVFSISSGGPNISGMIVIAYRKQ